MGHPSRQEDTHIPSWTCLTPLAYTALHCTALNYTALHCTALHCAALHCTGPHCAGIWCDGLYSTTLQSTCLSSPLSLGGPKQDSSVPAITRLYTPALSTCAAGMHSLIGVWKWFILKLCRATPILQHLSRCNSTQTSHYITLTFETIVQF